MPGPEIVAEPQKTPEIVRWFCPWREWKLNKETLAKGDDRQA
jgi:hypothetical protein